VVAFARHHGKPFERHLMASDYAIIGGGIVGLSTAWGLLRRGLRVTVLDGDDGAFRASRGNFGLVWVQSKGMNQPRYAQWSQTSAAAWAGLAAELSDATGHDLGLEQNGGYDLHFSEESLAETVSKYEILKEKLGGDYPYEVLGHNALRREEPAIGPKVVGAILHHQDGHANPLKLLRALADDVRRLGGQVLNGKHVTQVDKPDLFRISCADGTEVQARKIVLSAGLGAMSLGPTMGFKAPIRPQRGQVMITEKSIALPLSRARRMKAAFKLVLPTKKLGWITASRNPVFPGSQPKQLLRFQHSQKCNSCAVGVPYAFCHRMVCPSIKKAPTCLAHIL
jgi:glycine/D-amino acid oxidase-like deaminating enzyme